MNANYERETRKLRDNGRILVYIRCLVCEETYGWLCECAWTKTLVLRCLLDNGINGLELLVA